MNVFAQKAIKSGATGARADQLLGLSVFCAIGLRQRISAELNNAETEYRQIQHLLRSNADGATNAALIESLDVNRRIAVEAAGVMMDLLKVVSDSAKQVETAELRIARSFAASANENGGRL